MIRAYKSADNADERARLAHDMYILGFYLYESRIKHSYGDFAGMGDTPIGGDMDYCIAVFDSIKSDPEEALLLIRQKPVSFWFGPFY